MGQVDRLASGRGWLIIYGDIRNPLQTEPLPTTPGLLLCGGDGEHFEGG